MKKHELLLIKSTDTSVLDKRLADGWTVTSISAGGISTLLKCLHYCYVLIEKESKTCDC